MPYFMKKKTFQGIWTWTTDKGVKIFVLIPWNFINPFNGELEEGDLYSNKNKATGDIEMPNIVKGKDRNEEPPSMNAGRRRLENNMMSTSERKPASVAGTVSSSNGLNCDLAEPVIYDPSKI